VDCKKCHAPEGLTTGCLGCHTEIQGQLKSHQGYHFYLAQAKKTECAKCHSEHNGVDFSLINQTSWNGQDLKKFTHPQIKEFTLKDAHSKLECEKCHKGKRTTPYTLPKFPNNPRADTFLGLRQTCTACHPDPHEGGKITNCTQCHNQVHWKPAPNF